MAAKMRRFIDLLAKNGAVVSCFSCFFQRNPYLLLWPSVKYMHHPFTSISPAFLVLFFTKNNLWGEFEWWKFWNVAKVSTHFALKNNQKKQPNHGLFSRTFQGAVLQTEVGVDPFCAGIFHGMGKFCLGWWDHQDFVWWFVGFFV